MTHALAKSQVIPLVEPNGTSWSRLRLEFDWGGINEIPRAVNESLGAKVQRWLGRAPEEPTPEVDLQVSCLLFDALHTLVETVGDRQSEGAAGSVRYQEFISRGTRKQLLLDIEQIPDNIQQAVIRIHAFPGHTFETIGRTSITVWEAGTNTEVGTYTQSGPGVHTGILMVRLYRSPIGWALQAHGDRAFGRRASDVLASVEPLLGPKPEDTTGLVEHVAPKTSP